MEDHGRHSNNDSTMIVAIPLFLTLVPICFWNFDTCTKIVVLILGLQHEEDYKETLWLVMFGSPP